MKFFLTIDRFPQFHPSLAIYTGSLQVIIQWAMRYDCGE